MKESDDFQDKESRRGMCTIIVSRKHRPQEREAKHFQEERAPGSFQGGEEEVEMGKG
jgi:hypothetical protein